MRLLAAMQLLGPGRSQTASSCMAAYGPYGPQGPWTMGPMGPRGLGPNHFASVSQWFFFVLEKTRPPNKNNKNIQTYTILLINTHYLFSGELFAGKKNNNYVFRRTTTVTGKVQFFEEP